jgi:hypothetical protein
MSLQQCLCLMTNTVIYGGSQMLDTKKALAAHFILR